MTRTARLWMIALVSVPLIAIGAATLLLWIVLRTDWGHELVRKLLNEQITAGIAGELHVGRVEALSLRQLTVRDVKIVAPNGVPAIEADRAVIDFNLFKLWAGKYGWSRAEISGCLVRVTEDASHKTNMERTFADRETKTREERERDAHAQAQGTLPQVDLRQMVTHECSLWIGGGSLPKLFLRDLEGSMRVHVLGSGETELDFEHYRGVVQEGLPMGPLDFHDVRGDIATSGKRFLHFAGAGVNRESAVDFELAITRESPMHVRIDARFPNVTVGSVATAWAALWTKFLPGLELHVHYGEQAEAELEKQAER